jgi:hypothetical protein
MVYGASCCITHKRLTTILRLLGAGALAWEGFIPPLARDLRFELSEAIFAVAS